MVREDATQSKTGLVGLSSRTATCFKKGISAVSWTSNGDKLLVGGDSGGVCAFDTATLKTRELLERDSSYFEGHQGSIEAIVASPVSPYLFATACLDCSSNLYDIRTGSRPVKSVELSMGGINMAWSPDGEYILIGDNNDKLYVVDVEKYEVVRSLEESGKGKVIINQMKWHHTGSVLFLTRGDGQVAVRSWPSMKSLRFLSGHRASCVSVAVDKTGGYVAVSSDDSLISCWNASTLNCEFTIDRSRSPVRLLSYSHDGKYLASAPGDGGVDISQGRTGDHVTTVPTIARVNSLEWHPNRPVLAYSVEEPRRPVPGMTQRMYQNALPPAQPLPRAFVYGYPALVVDTAPPVSRHRPVPFQYQRPAGGYHR